MSLRATYGVVPCRLAALGLALVLAALAAPSPARATIVEALATAELVQRSHCVVLGRVIRAQSEMSADGSQIYTHVRIRLFRCLKKDGAGRAAPRFVDLTFEGGTVRGITMAIQGTPRFEPGAKVLVFLFRNDGEEAYRPLGLAYGCFECNHDLALGKPVGKRDLTGIEVVKIAPDGGTDAAEPPSGPVPLDSLVAEIQGAAGR